MYVSTSTEYFPEMYLSTFQGLYKLYLKKYSTLTFSQYPSIHTNYIIPHCTTLQYNHNI